MKRFALFILVAITVMATATASLAAEPISTTEVARTLVICIAVLLMILGAVIAMTSTSAKTISSALPLFALALIALVLITITGCYKQPPPPQQVYGRVTELPKDCDPKRVDQLEGLKATKEEELAAAENRLADETAKVNTKNEQLQGEINSLQQQLNSLVQSRPAQELDKNTGAVINKKEIDDHMNKEKKIGYQSAAKEAQIASNRVPIRNLIAQRDEIVREVEKLGKQLADELDCLAARLGESKIQYNNTTGDASKAPPVVVNPLPPDDGGGKKK